MANLYNVPLENGVQLTLQNALLTGETTTITFTASVTSKLQASSSIPGILVVDRVDSNGIETPTKTEYISFTGVTGSTVTGLVRGLANSTAQDHSAGAIVEFVPDVIWADSLNDVITTQHNADGTHKTLSLISLVSVTLNNPTINTPTFTGLAIAGGSLASVTIYNSKFDGLNITNTTITGASLVSISTVNRAYIPIVQKFIASTASTTVDWSVGNIHSYVLASGTATTTLNFANPVSGQVVLLRLAQGDTNRKVIFPSTIYWPGGVVPTLTTTAYRWDTFGFLCRASGYYDGYIVGLNIADA
jgi:hypothetical protein